MSSRLKGLQVRFPLWATCARSRQVAIELVKNGRAEAPDAGAHQGTGAGRRPARAGDSLLRVYSNVIRFLAPLTIPTRTSRKLPPCSSWRG